VKNKYKNLFRISFIVLFVILNLSYFSIVKAAVSAGSLIALANSSRAQAGLGDLSNNSQLESAAFAKANDMLEKDYFAHTSPEGKTPWDFIKEAGYGYVYAGENLAIGYTDAAELHNAWMNSPSHRDNILNPNFKEIGIAVASGEYEGSETTVVVQMFGSTDYSQPQSSENSGIQAEASNEAPSSENSGSNNQPTQEFTLLIDKSGFNPDKIYVDEEVTFKVVLTGEATEIYFTVGEQKIDMKEAVQAQQSSNEKIYEKKEKISQEGESNVSLVVSDKWGNREIKDLGKLTVAKKIITKDSNSPNTMFLAIKNFSIKHIKTIASVMASVIIIFGGFLIFYFSKHSQKFTLRTFFRIPKFVR